MSKKRPFNLPSVSDIIRNMVRIVRGQRIMLDFDLTRASFNPEPTATVRLITARWPAFYRWPCNRRRRWLRVKRRFPDDFAYQPTQQEFVDLMSQIVISNRGHA
jgi:hypothetical protein